ncbi:hypothetical protein ABE10_01615, partial [Bacillus toyonensis]|nr:hypothetical protein [Bacillus toyonensis]
GAGLARDGAREERLTRSRRAVQQHALGDAGADGLELRRVLQELLDLVELFDRLVRAGDVGEGDRGSLLAHELGARLAELHDLAAAALRRREQPPEQQAEEDHRQQQGEEAVEPAGLGHRVVEAVLGRGGVDRFDDLARASGVVIELDGVGTLVCLAQLHVDALVAIGRHDLGDRAALEQVETLLGGDLFRGAEAGDQHEPADQQQTDQQHVDQRIPGDLLDIHDRISVSRRGFAIAGDSPTAYPPAPPSRRPRQL